MLNPLKDLFKTPAQKAEEESRAAKAKAKETREQALRDIFVGKRAYEVEIDALKIDKEKLSKEYKKYDPSSKDAAVTLAKFKKVLKKLENLEAEYENIKDIADALVEEPIIPPIYQDKKYKTLDAIRKLTIPEVVGGISDEDKLNIDMQVERAITKQLSSTRGVSGLERLGEKAREKTGNIDDEISDADAIAEINGTKQKEKIDARLERLDAKLGSTSGTEN
jgi:hypothetical protein